MGASPSQDGILICHTREGPAMQGRLLPAAALLLALAGCDDTPAGPQAPPPSAPTPLGAAFDPADAGTVSGHVAWAGDAPSVPDHVGHLRPQTAPPLPPPQSWPNPHAPRIGPDRG